MYKMGCSSLLVKRQMELSRKQEKWNNLVHTSVTRIYQCFSILKYSSLSNSFSKLDNLLKKLFIHEIFEISDTACTVLQKL